MAELNRIRYWTRKVIPDALPRVSDGRVSIEDAMETAVNRKELEQVEDEATQTAARQPQEQEKTEGETAGRNCSYVKKSTPKKQELNIVHHILAVFSFFSFLPNKKRMSF